MRKTSGDEISDTGLSHNAIPRARYGGEAKAGSARYVVFDFDRTLYGGDTRSELVIWLIRQNWWRLLAAAVMSPVILPFWFFADRRRQAISAYLWIATAGVCNGDDDLIIERYTAANIDRLRSRMVPKGIDELIVHRRAGDHVVVATGAPSQLVRRILAAVSQADLDVVGSTLRLSMGGLILEKHCYASHKITMVAEKGYISPFGAAYSDNIIDLPVLSRAFRPIVVNPRLSCIASFRHALGEDVEIQYWPSTADERQPPTIKGRSSVTRLLLTWTFTTRRILRDLSVWRIPSFRGRHGAQIPTENRRWVAARCPRKQRQPRW